MTRRLPNTAVPWFPSPKAAPRTRKEAAWFVTAANGTATCCGGWQFEYRHLPATGGLAIQAEVQYEDLACVRDSLMATAIWGEIGPETARLTGNAKWDYLMPDWTTPGTVRFTGLSAAPAAASVLTVRYTFRWSKTGCARWCAPVLRRTPVPAPSRPVRVGVVTGHMHARRDRIRTIADNAAFYAAQCEAACRRAPLDLIALPEICLQWQIPGDPLDRARPVSCPELRPLRAVARRRRVRLVVGMLERDRGAVYNTALLIAPDGRDDGRYRKVHLANGGEAESGISPGDAFPVFDTEIGRLGCNICMDSSAAESSRLVGLNGAAFLVLPIMGDHRASRWTPGVPIFDDGRWLAIMRTRAMDSQLCMVVARNEARGSCIIDRRGDVLAWNDGDRDFVSGEVRADDGYRIWNGSCFREVNWLQRRPHLYGPFTDATNLGPYHAPACRAPGRSMPTERPSPGLTPNA